MKDESIVALAAIIGLVVLETTAMLTHTNGVFLLPIVAAIAGLGGFELKTILKR